MSKAILMVSFGTSYESTREKTIGKMGEAFRQAFPDRTLYQAYTSERILAIIKKRDGILIDTIEEALLRMIRDGVNDLLVQPTHILNGIENDSMKEIVNGYKEAFQEIRLGAPLLNSSRDYSQVIDAIAETFTEYNLGREDAVVLMGHGTEHYSNAAYGALDYVLKEKGLDSVYVATVEAYPTIEEAIGLMRQKNYKKVLLLPFMIVAGEHANKDMVGPGEESFRSVLKKEGYEVEYRLRGLGEYEKIRELFIQHANNSRPLSQ
ncbi:MAG: sirohydrochlorin cobaltochelatase [Lachnospiraceae bacterium]